LSAKLHSVWWGTQEVLFAEFGAALRAAHERRGVAEAPLKGVEPRSPNLYRNESDRNMFSLSRFEELLKYLPRAAFKKIVREHNADRYVKHFGCDRLLVTMLYAHASEARSLRALEIGLNQHRNHHYHLGIGKVSRSTVSEAAERRKPKVFEEVLKLLIQMAGRNVRQAREEMLYLLDSTCIPLVGRGLQWAGKLATRIPGLRLHLLYASNQQLPVYFSITGENVPDVVEGRAIAIQPGAIYVFDKGYCDYEWWSRIDAAGASFVTRLKKNAAVKIQRVRPLDPEVKSILADEEITFRHSSNRAGHRNALAGATLRRIEVLRDTGERLVLITNDLHSSAAKIAALYKERWQIELFFKWIKQNLKIKKFLGENDNAIRIQLLSALIGYVLLILKKAAEGGKQTLREMMDQLRTGLFHRAQTELSRYRRKRQEQARVAAVQPGLFR
jgi:IS4 transposase